MRNLWKNLLLLLVKLKTKTNIGKQKTVESINEVELQELVNLFAEAIYKRITGENEFTKDIIHSYENNQEQILIVLHINEKVINVKYSLDTNIFTLEYNRLTSKNFTYYQEHLSEGIYNALNGFDLIPSSKKPNLTSFLN